MDNSVNFIYQGRQYTADIMLDLQEDPCFIFAFLKDQSLIARFGIDIDIKTDCEKVLFGKILDPGLQELKVAIFNAVKDSGYLLSYIQRKSNNSITE